MLKRIAKKALAARAEQVFSQQLPVDRKTLDRVSWLLESKNLRKIGVLAVGGAASISVLGNVSRTRMVRRAMAREMKKQLEPIKKQLNELEAQNEELKKQNRQLQDRLAHAK